MVLEITSSGCTIATIILIIIVTISGFALYNLLKKNETLEDFIAKQSEAVNECGVSGQSCNPGSLLLLPEPVQNVDASDGTYNNQVIIIWEENENTDSYKIYRDNIWNILGILGVY